MGTAKALLPLAGRTFVEAVAEALDGVAGEIVLLGAGLVPKPLERLRRLADAPGVDGPLGGVLAALRSEPGADWLVAACDQPLLTEEAVSWLVAEAGRSEAVALLARREPSRVEPFPGFFARASLPLVEALAARGDRKSTRLNSSHNGQSRMPSSA